MKWRVLAAVVAVVLLATLMPVSVGAQDVQFDDVPARHTFFDEISWLAAQGITEGCNAERTSFCPGLAVTRGQMAAFLVRAFNLTHQSLPDRFLDDDDSIFEDDIDTVGATGISFGCDPPLNYHFCPHDFVTREQMAAFIHRAVTHGQE